MNLHDKYFHWYFGENILRDDNATCLFNLELGVAIYFDYGDGYFATYERFVNEVANINFFTGDRPDDTESILSEAWNFLCEFEKVEEDQTSINQQE